MRWPLRNQIFLPFAALLTASIVVVAVVSAWKAAEQSRAQKVAHMQSVAGALGDAGFPVDQNIAQRLAAMIEGEIVVLESQTQVKASTLPASADLTALLSQAAVNETDQTFEIEWNTRRYLVTAISRHRGGQPGTLFVLIPDEDFLALRRDSIVPPLTVAVGTLVLALGIAMLISGRVSGRVDRLRQLFRDLSQGRFQSVSVQGRHDELRDLLESANDLSAQLNELQKDLVRSERLQLLGQLSGGLAHQLRNSITGARLAVQLHQRKCDSKVDDMLKTAIDQLRLTEEQVLAVLSLRPRMGSPAPGSNGRSETPHRGSDDSHAEQDSFSDTSHEHTGDDRESVNVVELVQEVRDLLQPQCAHWQSEIIVENAAPIIIAQWKSVAAMKGALLNLVLNAIEAAGISGRVRICVTSSQNAACIEIRDDGDGFPDDSHTFAEPFRTSKPEGIGLGLTIAQHAVEQESGRLSISRKDDWTSVLIEAPLAEAAVPQEIGL